ncbi:MAG: hypothetical protein RL481_665 [Pseudomonadota bacterium]
MLLIGAVAMLSCCKANGQESNEANVAEAKGDLPRSDLYQCEGCEGALEADGASLTGSTQMALPEEPGEKMTLDGTVFATDGKTPAVGVIIYAYQTNAEGFYANGSPQTDASRQHGRIRGWIKTGADGRYQFRTIKPAPYPNDTIPAHIHFTILENGKRPYWIDDIVFQGEVGVTDAYRRAMTNKGGNGIVAARKLADGSWQVTRDITLERHPD